MKIKFSTLLRWFGIWATPIMVVAITILSLSPPSDVVGIVSIFPFGDKGAHVLAYAAMAFCMLCAIGHSGEAGTIIGTIRRNRCQMVSIMILLIIIGGAIELVQPLFLRGAEWQDLIADCIGGVLGLFLGVVIITIVERWEQKRGTS